MADAIAVSSSCWRGAPSRERWPALWTLRRRWWRRRSLWNAAPAAAAAGDDWPLFRGDPGSTGVARSTLPAELELLWKFPVKGGGFDATPAVVGGRVYIGDMDGKLYALDLATGKALWRSSSALVSSPRPPSGTDCCTSATSTGKLHCLKAADGKRSGASTAEAEIDSSANFFQDKVLFGSQDATLYCLNAKSGELAWKYTIADQIRCTPTVVEDRVLPGRLRRPVAHHGSEAGPEAASVDDRVADRRDAGGASATGLLRHRRRATFFCVDWKQAKVVWTFTGDEPRPAVPQLPGGRAASRGLRRARQAGPGVGRR